MGTTKPQYEIRQTQWNSEWEEETITLYSGSIRQQMEKLFLRIRDTTSGPKIIRIFLVDKEGNEFEPDESYY